MNKRNFSLDQPSTPPIEEQRTIVRKLRHEILQKHRSSILQGVSPIYVMARIVNELLQICHQRHFSEEVLQSEAVNRTIGDVDLRRVIECEGEPGGRKDYRMLADEIGLALPNEDFAGYKATGNTYLWLREQMMVCERELLASGYDLRIYDIYGVGNPILREWLAQDMRRWGLPVTASNVFLSLGGMDGIDKVLRGLQLLFRNQGQKQVAFLCPEPAFGLPQWQAQNHGYRLHAYQTQESNKFKLTANELDQLLTQHPDIHVLYLTITNNPTALSYTATELYDLYNVIQRYHKQGHTLYIVGDLAYIGTGIPEADRERMQTFAYSGILQHTILISSLSKTHTLTGERLGWITCGDLALANSIAPSWSNSVATLPGEWQLRFMAYYHLFQERPWLTEKLRNLYRLRRRQFRTQLEQINSNLRLFSCIYDDDDATVYNWSKLHEGQDVFLLFEQTGIAGIPGTGFGYTDNYVRFSIGVLPIYPLRDKHEEISWPV